MTNSTIKDLILSSNAFNIISSQISKNYNSTLILDITHTTITNLTKDLGSIARFMQVELESVLIMNNVTFTDMEVSIINCFSSDMEIESVTGEHIISNQYIAD